MAPVTRMKMLRLVVVRIDHDWKGQELSVVSLPVTSLIDSEVDSRTMREEPIEGVEYRQKKLHASTR